EPLTNPPPVTRSSSVSPVTTRAALSVSPESGTRLVGRPLALADFGPAPTPLSVISSTLVFHSPPASHRPFQREVTAPQAWQTKDDRALAISGLPLLSGGAAFGEAAQGAPVAGGHRSRTLLDQPRQLGAGRNLPAIIHDQMPIHHGQPFRAVIVAD